MIHMAGGVQFYHILWPRCCISRWNESYINNGRKHVLNKAKQIWYLLTQKKYVNDSKVSANFPVSRKVMKTTETHSIRQLERWVILLEGLGSTSRRYWEEGAPSVTRPLFFVQMKNEIWRRRKSRAVTEVKYTGHWMGGWVNRFNKIFIVYIYEWFIGYPTIFIINLDAISNMNLVIKMGRRPQTATQTAATRPVYMSLYEIDSERDDNAARSRSAQRP